MSEVLLVKGDAPPARPSRDDLLAQLNLVERAIEAERAEIARIRPVLEDHPLKSYVPLGLPGSGTRGQQYAFHISPAAERIATGGNRSGKSVVECAEIAFHITGAYPDWWPKECRIWDGELNHRPLRWRMYAPSYEKGINDVLWPLLESFLPRSMQVRPKVNSSGGFTMAEFPNGAELSFMSYSQSVRLAAGWKGHGASFDEPPPDREIYLETLRGLMDYNGRSILAMTTVGTGTPWVDKMFVRMGRGGSKKQWPQSSGQNSQSWPGPLDTHPRHFVFSTMDNPHLSEARKEHWLARLGDDDAKARVYGQTMVEEYLVFKQWNDDLHIVHPEPLPYRKDTKRPDGWTLHMGLDPHDAIPQFMLWMAVWPADKNGVIKKRIIRESFERGYDTIPKAAGRLKEIEEQTGVAERRVIDPNFGPKKYGSSGLTVMQEWSKAGNTLGWPMYFAAGNDNVELGHNAIRKWLTGTCADGTPEFAIYENCPELIDSMRYFSYKGNFDVDERSQYKHGADTLRYIAMQNPRYIDPVESIPREIYVPDEVTGW